jgi:signal transduction histidine kinase
VLRQGGFSVCDSGAGIPPEKRESVFQPFVRGDATRGDGLGLGLSLVQRICQRQGWHIRLSENPSGGCEFRVDFSAS